jgi:membrane-bound ClpP family serine protease
MRALLVTLMALGLALVVAGAVTPDLFVLSLLGMLVLAGTASVAIAGSMQNGPRPHY